MKPAAPLIADVLKYAAIFVIIIVLTTFTSGEILHQPLSAIHELHVPFSRMVGLVYVLAPVIGILVWILLRLRWPVLSVVVGTFIWCWLYSTELQFAIQQTEVLVVSRELTALERAKLRQLPFPFLEYRSNEDHIVVENRQEWVNQLRQELTTLQLLKPAAPGLHHTLYYGVIPYQRATFGSLLMSGWRSLLLVLALLPLSSLWKWHRSRRSSPALATVPPTPPDNNVV